MKVSQTCKHIAFLFLVITVICLNSCTSGWYGTTAHIQESQIFVQKNKSGIIEQLGIPDSSFGQESGVEYWLYKSYSYSYFVFWGRKKEKGLILKFKDNSVRSTYFVDQGVLEEIATRGWEYLKTTVDQDIK